MFRTLLLMLLMLVERSLEHGRMMEPPSRASAWRVGFPTPRVHSAAGITTKKQQLYLREHAKIAFLAEAIAKASTPLGFEGI